jgi:hypothetical protein
MAAVERETCIEQVILHARGKTCRFALPLPLLALVEGRLPTSRDQYRRHGALVNAELLLLDRNAHVASVSALATVALVLADALVCAEPGVLASLARALAIAALLALAASLAARLGGEILLLGAAERARHVQGGCIGALARLRRQRCGGDGLRARGRADRLLRSHLSRAGSLRLGLGSLDAGSGGPRLAGDRGKEALGSGILDRLVCAGLEDPILTLVAAGLGAVLARQDIVEVRAEPHSSAGRKDWARFALLATSRRQLILALALVLAGSASGRGSISLPAEGIIQGGGRRATVRDVRHLAQSHQLKRDIFVFLRHAAAHSRVRRGKHAVAVRGGASLSICGVGNAATSATALRSWRCVGRMVWKAIAKGLGRLEGVWVGEGVVRCGRVGEGGSLVLEATSGRDGGVRSSSRHLRWCEQRQLL